MFDPARWPDRLHVPVLIALGVVFVALAFWPTLPRPLAAVWIVYPGLFGALIWRFDRRAWRDIASWTIPLTALMAVVYVLPGSAIGLLLGFVATAWLMLFIFWLPPVGWWYRFVLRMPLPPHYETRWTEMLPSRFAPEPAATKIGGDRILDADGAAARLIDEVMAGGDPLLLARAASRLASKARREARRPGTWQQAWLAQAAWLGALADQLSGEETRAGADRVNALGVVYGDAMRAAIARAREVDPTLVEPKQDE